MSVVINGKNYFSLFWHSDEHTLHPHTPTSHILSNIDRLRNEVGADAIDMEVWGGDLCDDNTYTSNPDYIYLQNWVKEYLHDCHERKRLVRILAGTTSHDWEQPEMFELLKPKDSPYIKYVDTLSIEYIEEFDIHILYVPDNFGNKPKTEIYNDAVELIASYGLKQVDFIFLHGGFEYQLPPAPNQHDSLYNSKAWSALASKIILSGHIHKPSTRYNIYCSGSLDRLQHGEMHPKGAYHVLFNKSDVIPTFIENKRAMIYDEIKLSPTDTSTDIFIKMEKYLSNDIMRGASIRLSGGIAEEVNPVLTDLLMRYPNYRFDAKNLVSENIVSNEEVYEPEHFQSVTLSEQNFKESFFRYIGENLPEGITMEGLEKELDEAMGVEDVE